MNFTNEELKLLLCDSLADFTDYSCEELLLRANAPTEENDFPDVDAMAAVENVSFFDGNIGKLSFYLSFRDDIVSLLLIVGDGCQSVDKANAEIGRFSKTSISKVFYVVSDITDELDALMLEARFFISRKEYAKDMLKYLFSLLLRDEFMKSAEEMLSAFC